MASLKIDPRLNAPLYNSTGVNRLAHDPTKVRVIHKMRRAGTARFNLVTPFAGKPFLKEYCKSLDNLPCAEAHAVFYDNSNDPEYRQQLEAILERFPSHTLIEDRNAQFTVENTADYSRITWRSHNIYKELYERQIDKKLPLCLNIEDDTGVPAGAMDRLESLLSLDKRVATASGVQCSRRMNDDHAARPMVWNFRRVESIGGHKPVEVLMDLVPDKPFGIEDVGATGQGLWLTKTSVVNRLGMDFGCDGVFGQDLSWGYAVNQAGYLYVVDWSLRAKHYGIFQGKRICV